MKQDAILKLAGNGMNKTGSLAPWVRRSLVQGGASGIVTETAPPVTHNVIAHALGPQAVRMLSAEWWVSAEVRLAIAALGLTFDPEAESGSPEVHFEDTVTWAGKTYRVTGIETFHAPGEGKLPPKAYLYFAGLAT